MKIPFLISKLVTRLIASRGDLDEKNLGVRLGGKVSGLRVPAVPAALSAQAAAPRNDMPIGELNLSRCSVDTGRVACRCFGYQPRAGPPANRNISPLANMAEWCCIISRVLLPLPLLLLLRTVLSRVLPPPAKAAPRGLVIG